MTGYGSPDGAIEAIRAGAFDYVTKPLIDDELRMAIERATLATQRTKRERQPARAARSPLRHGQHRRPRPADAQSIRDDRQRGRHAGHRAGHRRKRHRQIDDRPGGPPPQRPRQGAVRRSGLRCTAGNAAGKRAVRPRRRRLHGRGGRKDGQVPAGRRRHDLPRRDRHGQSGHASQAAPRAARTEVRTSRRQQNVRSRRPRRAGHERRPRREPWPKAASARICTTAST